MPSIRDLRKITGLTQSEFAALIGITPGSMRNIESQGLRISPDRLRIISDETGCGLDFGPDHTGQTGICLRDGKIVLLDPVGIKLVQRFQYVSDGPAVRFSTSDKKDNPFTKEYFVRHRATKNAKDRLGTFSKAIYEFINAILVVSLIYGKAEADELKDKDRAVQTMRDAIDGILEGVIEAAGSSFNGIDEVTHHLEANRWWAVDWSKYPNGYVPEDLVKSLRDLVSDDDLRAIIFPGGTSPQN